MEARPSPACEILLPEMKTQSDIKPQNLTPASREPRGQGDAFIIRIQTQKELQESKPNFFPQNTVNKGGWGGRSLDPKKKSFWRRMDQSLNIDFTWIQIQTNKIKTVASWSN